MEVDHDYGENHDTAVVSVTLVLHDAICVNSKGMNKASTYQVVVVVGCC